MTIPTSTEITCTMYSVGTKPEKSIIERSMRYPNANETTTSRRMLTFAVRSIFVLSVRMYCRATSSRLKAMVKFPRVNCVNTSERLYGIDVMGDVPREAFVMKPTAIDMQNNPNAKTAYRLANPDSMRRSTTCCISTHRIRPGIRPFIENTASAISPISAGRRSSTRSSLYGIPSDDGTSPVLFREVPIFFLRWLKHASVTLKNVSSSSTSKGAGRGVIFTTAESTFGLGSNLDAGTGSMISQSAR